MDGSGATSEQEKRSLCVFCGRRVGREEMVAGIIHVARLLRASLEVRMQNDECRVMNEGLQEEEGELVDEGVMSLEEAAQLLGIQKSECRMMNAE